MPVINVKELDLTWKEPGVEHTGELDFLDCRSHPDSPAESYP